MSVRGYSFRTTVLSTLHWGKQRYLPHLLFSLITIFESLPDRGAFLWLSENTREDDHDEFAI